MICAIATPDKFGFPAEVEELRVEQHPVLVSPNTANLIRKTVGDNIWFQLTNEYGEAANACVDDAMHCITRREYDRSKYRAPSDPTMIPQLFIYLQSVEDREFALERSWNSQRRLSVLERSANWSTGITLNQSQDVNPQAIQRKASLSCLSRRSLQERERMVGEAPES